MDFGDDVLSDIQQYIINHILIIYSLAPSSLVSVCGVPETFIDKNTSRKVDSSSTLIQTMLFLPTILKPEYF